MFILSRSILFAWVYFIAISFIFISFNPATASARTLSRVAPYTETELLQEVNLVRVEAGLPPLVAQVDLEGAAKIKGVYMTMKKYFDHWSPDGLVSPWNFLNLAGYKYKHAGENLAINYNSANEVIEAMMASPKHRDNLLGTKYTDIGIEVYTGPFEGVFSSMVVMYFGTRL